MHTACSGRAPPTAGPPPGPAAHPGDQGPHGARDVNLGTEEGRCLGAGARQSQSTSGVGPPQETSSPEAPASPRPQMQRRGGGRGQGGPGAPTSHPGPAQPQPPQRFAAPGAPTPPGHLCCWPEPQWGPDPTCHLRGPWEKGMPRRHGRSHTMASGGPEPHAAQQVPHGPPPLSEPTPAHQGGRRGAHVLLGEGSICRAWRSP